MMDSPLARSPSGALASLHLQPEEEFGALKDRGRQWSKFPNLGGRGTPAQFFKFLVKSISGRFSNMMVKYEFILIKLTGRNNQFSFRNFHHFFKNEWIMSVLV